MESFNKQLDGQKAAREEEMAKMRSDYESVEGRLQEEITSLRLELQRTSEENMERASATRVALEQEMIARQEEFKARISQHEAESKYCK